MADKGAPDFCQPLFWACSALNLQQLLTNLGALGCALWTEQKTKMASTIQTRPGLNASLSVPGGACSARAPLPRQPPHPCRSP